MRISQKRRVRRGSKICWESAQIHPEIYLQSFKLLLMAEPTEMGGKVKWADFIFLRFSHSWVFSWNHAYLSPLNSNPEISGASRSDHWMKALGSERNIHHVGGLGLEVTWNTIYYEVCGAKRLNPVTHSPAMFPAAWSLIVLENVPQSITWQALTTGPSMVFKNYRWQLGCLGSSVG